MSATQDLIRAKFAKLAEEGAQTLRNCGYFGHESRYQRHPNDVDYLRFRTEAANLIKRACGEDSHHYYEIKRISESKDTATNSYYYKDCVGIVQAAKSDFEGGLLFDLKTLVLAEMLGDFLEQAEVLVAAGYDSAAASLAGAVLEDSLRKLCVKHNLPLPEKTKIDRLNADLAKAGVYTVLVQKKITALADIRNNADHGHHDKFKKADVEDMVRDVRRFVTDHLG